MQPNNLTALDFGDIKSSIKSYLRTRSEFTDYDFEGAALSYLIDTLAYNTYYTAFNANMSMNEAFLPSATVRDNVVNIAKLLNYVPRSVVAARACVKLVLQTKKTSEAYPSTVTLKKGAILQGGAFMWNILADTTISVDPTTGIATYDDVTVKQGAILQFSYTVNTFASQVYKIPSENCDISTLTVNVKANETSTTSDLYNKVDTITSLTPTSRVYFLSEGEDMRYEIKFGDDSIGRALSDGEVVTLEYLVTDGAEANDVNVFNFIGRCEDSLARTYTASDITMTLKMKSGNGEVAETIESIKYNAPRYYSSQYRAVTAQDYSIITKKVYDNAESVVAYGGDSLNPPIYGKVYIAIKTKTGSLLNDQTKKSIAADLRGYAMASIDPVVIDPENVYIYPKVFVQYDTGCGSDTSTIKTNVSAAVEAWATQTQINNFNSTFRSSQFEKAITLADRCVTDVSLQTTVLRYIKPTTNQTNTYSISTGSALYNSAPSKDGGDGVCKKEPILLSGTFRTSDRPGVDQQFEDDGYGNLRTFYNTGTRKIYTNANAGTVNYDTGEIAFGPIAIIGAGLNISLTAVNITDSQTGAGSVTDSTLLPVDLQIPVQFIPSNSNSIPASTPGTIINIVLPEITVAAVGTAPPPTIPLNSLTPTIFDQTPSTVTVATQTATNLNTSSCL
tara:strand:+ start:19437 stop:21461 length:2025 start_codon:yes stop_codon:yes gene_type:complete